MPKIVRKIAPARRAPAPQPAPPAPAAPPPPSETPDLDDTPPADALSAMLAELADGGEGSTVTVYRELKGQKPGYLFRTSPEGFSLDKLRDDYNGGDFRLYITRNGVLYRNTLVTVEPPIQRAALPAQSVDMAAAVRDAVAPLADAVARSLAPRPSLFDMQRLPEIITATAGAITALRSLIPTPAQAAPAQRERGELDSFLKAFKLAQELQGKGSGDDGDVSLMGMIRELIRSPVVLQAVTGALAQAKPAATPRAPMPPAQAALPGAAPVAAAPAAAPAVDAGVAQQVDMLCEKADADADPAIYAALIVDNAPRALIEAWLAPDDPVAALAEQWPQIAERREWFLELADALRQELQEVYPAPSPDGQGVPHAGLNGTSVLETAHTTRRGAAGNEPSDDAPSDRAPAVSRRTPPG
jgi:hypothetical protein